MKHNNKEVPTSPFKTLYDLVEDGHEFTITDTYLDCEFYIYKGDLDDPMFEYLVETQEVHCLPNGSLMVDLSGLLATKVKELRDFVETDWKDGAYVSEDDEEFVFDFLEDVVNVLHQGHYNYSKKVVNILRGSSI